MSKSAIKSKGLSATIATIVTALLIVVGGLSFFANQASADLESKFERDIALYQAQSLTTLVTSGREAQADNATISAALKDALTRARRGNDYIRIVALADKSIVASTFPEDQQVGGFPRRLIASEKPLYDAIRALPKEGAATGVSSNIARASAPFFGVDGLPLGYVEVGRKTAPLLTATWHSPLFIGMLAGLSGLALGLAMWNPALRGWAGVGLALAVAGIGWGAIDSHMAGLTLEGIKQVAAQATAMSDAAVGAGQSLNWRIEAVPETSAAAADIRDKAAASGLQNSIYALGIIGALITAFVGFGGASATGRAFRENPTAYFYVAPALLGMLALAFFPFFYGFILSFTDTTLLNQGASWGERWVGFANYAAILNDFNFGGSGSAFNYQNFYWTLGVTVLWTVTNVFLGVSIGLAMALLLNIKGLKGVAIYRTLLILPWAIPNYITALTWKGMFHPQFGSINQAIQAFGGQPVQWFDSFGPSFITGLATNAWLSFPFMMVVALGALQAVDEDMYEAARIDGASPWQQFWHITLPSLRPALLPAVIVSVVWTFNMFNVIYLVSAGQPSGSTEILVTRAYKIAFEEYRYGYAAAYSVVIFMILLVYGVFQIKATAATEANNK